MDVLIIGGTKFLGRALVDVLLQNEHTITLFNRGKTNPGLYPQVETIIGDRDGQTANLGERSWDVVIDTCGYVPRIVNQSVQYLKGRTKQYVFVSSISVYKENPTPNQDESAEVIELEDKASEDIYATPESYGGLKVLCERATQDGFGEDSLIIRPGLIVGPHDPTNRFTYWPVRIRKGGKTLAPGNGSGFIQVVDVRDLAEFMVNLIEKNVNGVFNVTGPTRPLRIDELLDRLIQVTQSDTELVWKQDQWLLDNKVGPWMEMPLWAPSPAFQASMQTNISKSMEYGMTFRALEETVQDTLVWYDTIIGDEKEWPAGLDAKKEMVLLTKA